MIRQLGVFTSEVTRVAREVGTDGKLGGQAQVQDVSGVWKELTDSVNQMASTGNQRSRLSKRLRARSSKGRVEATISIISATPRPYRNLKQDSRQMAKSLEILSISFRTSLPRVNLLELNRDLDLNLERMAGAR